MRPDPCLTPYIATTADPLPPGRSGPGEEGEWRETAADRLIREQSRRLTEQHATIAILARDVAQRDQTIAALRNRVKEDAGAIRNAVDVANSQAARAEACEATISSLRARLARAEAIEVKAKALIDSRRGPSLRDGDTARTSLAIVALSDFESLAAALTPPSPAGDRAERDGVESDSNLRAVLRTDLFDANERVAQRDASLESAARIIAELRDESAKWQEANAERLAKEREIAADISDELDAANTMVADLKAQLEAVSERERRLVETGRVFADEASQIAVFTGSTLAAYGAFLDALAAYATPESPTEADQS